MGFNWGSAAQGFSQGGLIPGIAGGFLYDDPEKDANKYLDQIPDELKKYLTPYIEHGEKSYGNLNDISGEYANMYKDPNAIIQRLGAGYKQSPGYKWRLNQGENSINNAAAAGGMAGTAQHQQQAGELAENLASQDFNDFMKNILGIYTGGLSGRTGIEQDIYGKGATASSDLATGIANWLNQKGGLAYQGAKNRNQQWSDTFSNIASAGKSLFGG
jgi:hypothetical protein